MNRRALTSAAALIGAVLVLASCSGGSNEPTTAQAGKQLAKDGRALIKDLYHSSQHHITKDATRDMPCEGGGAKREFAATANIELLADVDKTLDHATDATVGQLIQHGYKLQNLPASDAPRRTIVSKAKGGMTFTVTITRAGYTVAGKTACLATS